MRRSGCSCLPREIGGAVKRVPAFHASAYPSRECALDEVVSRKRVALRAASFGSASRRYPTTPQGVFARGYWTAVQRVAATSRAVVADVVIEGEAFGDRPDLPFIANTMRKAGSTFIADDRVSLVGSVTLPDVTAVGIGDPANLRGLFTLSRRVPRDKHPDNLAAFHRGEFTVSPLKSPPK